MNLMLPFLVFAPMGGAVLSFLIGRRSEKARDAFAAALTALVLLTAVLLLAYTAAGREIAPFAAEGFCGLGLHMRLDGFRAVYLTVAALMWASTALFSPEYFAHYRNRNRYHFFTLMTLGATLGVFLSDDLYTTFISFEIMSFTSYAWVAHDEKPAAMRAAKTYLAVAVIGGMATLMGLFLLYRRLGTLSFDGMYAQMLLSSSLANPAPLYLAGGLIVFGFGAKAGMFPLHIWLPKAHPVAPAPASALLSGILTKTGVFGILVVACNLFRRDQAFGSVMLALGASTMVLGALLALLSVDLKRTLACSSMSQIGFILIGVALQPLLGGESALAAQGTIIYMVNHSLFKLTLFLCAGVVYMNLHKLNLNDIRGFGRNKPFLMLCFLSGALGISGVPLFSGYIGKSLIHEALLEYIAEASNAAPYRLTEVLFIVSGGLTLAYMTKLFVTVFVQKHPQLQAEYDARTAYIRPLSRLALAVPALLIPLFGLLPDVFMTGISSLAAPFMRAETRSVAYFSLENLLGAGKSILIGAFVYAVIARYLLTRRDESGLRVWVDRRPEWLDLENAVYRPVISILLRALGGVASLFDALTDRALLPALRAVGTFFARLTDSLTDWIALGCKRTVFAALRPRTPPPVGNRLTYALGTLMDRGAALLNKTLCKKRPIKTKFVYALAAAMETLDRSGRHISRSLSFSLLMFSIGLMATLIYLLTR